MEPRSSDTGCSASPLLPRHSPYLPLKAPRGPACKEQQAVCAMSPGTRGSSLQGVLTSHTRTLADVGDSALLIPSHVPRQVVVPDSSLRPAVVAV